MVLAVTSFIMIQWAQDTSIYSASTLKIGGNHNKSQVRLIVNQHLTKSQGVVCIVDFHIQYMSLTPSVEEVDCRLRRGGVGLS